MDFMGYGYEAWCDVKCEVSEGDLKDTKLVSNHPLTPLLITYYRTVALGFAILVVIRIKWFQLNDL